MSEKAPERIYIQRMSESKHGAPFVDGFSICYTAEKIMVDDIEYVRSDLAAASPVPDVAVEQQWGDTICYEEHFPHYVSTIADIAAQREIDLGKQCFAAQPVSDALNDKDLATARSIMDLTDQEGCYSLADEKVAISILKQYAAAHSVSVAEKLVAEKLVGEIIHASSFDDVGKKIRDFASAQRAQGVREGLERAANLIGTQVPEDTESGKVMRVIGNIYGAIYANAIRALIDQPKEGV